MINTINTIFYFVNDFDTYQLKVLQHAISAKTIVFVEDQLAIYKDGKRYGNMGYDDIKLKVIEIVTNDEDGKRAAGDAYDDSGLIDALDRIDAITRAELERLSNLIQQLDTEIQERVNTMFKDPQWIRENVAQNEYLHQDMTWIGDEINAYLQQVGYWTTDSHGNTITQWSKIQQSVDSISTNVNALSQNVDGRFTAVQSSINQSVDQKIQTAKTEISNMYALGQDVNDIKKVVEWMYSGLKSSAGPTQSIAQIVSAGQGAAEAAISDMRTLVNKLENGDYVATASLETQVQSIVSGAISTAGFVSQSDLTSAIATVSAKFTDPATNITGWSDLFTAVNTLDGQINNAQAGLVTRMSTVEGNVQTLNQAGFLTESTLDSAFAEMIAESNGANGTSKAAIQAIANNAASSVVISADTIDARVNQIMVSGDGTFRGDVLATSFTAGGSGLAGIVIQSGNFDSTGADTSKIYIAYDPSEQCCSMFVYDTTNSKWATLSLTKAFKYDDFFLISCVKYLPTTEYSTDDGTTWITGILSGTDLTQSPWNTYKYRNGHIIPSNASSISSSDFSTMTIYKNQDDERYYWEESATVANRIDDSFHRNLPSTQPSSKMWQYLGKTNDDKAIVAIINYGVVGASYGYEHGILLNTSFSGEAIYSPNAVLDYTIDPDYTIHITRRGFAFLNPVSFTDAKTLFNKNEMSSIRLHRIVDTDNKVYTGAYNSGNYTYDESIVANGYISSHENIAYVTQPVSTYGTVNHYSDFVNNIPSGVNAPGSMEFAILAPLSPNRPITMFTYLYTATSAA